MILNINDDLGNKHRHIFNTPMESIEVVANYMMKFLVRSRLIDRDARMFIEGEFAYIYPKQYIYNIHRFVVRTSELLGNINITKSDDECHIYVVQTYNHLKEGIRAYNHDIISMMNVDIILVSMDTLKATLTIANSSLFYYCDKQEDNDINVSNALSLCTTDHYETLELLLPKDINTNKIEHVITHKSNDMLDIFGADYIFVVYRSLKLFDRLPYSTLYIIRDSHSVELVTLNEK